MMAMKACTRCEGRGGWDVYMECEACDGNGIIDMGDDEEPCPECGSEGSWDEWEICGTCDGAGQVEAGTFMHHYTYLDGHWVEEVGGEAGGA